MPDPGKVHPWWIARGELHVVGYSWWVARGGVALDGFHVAFGSAVFVLQIALVYSFVVDLLQVVRGAE